MRTRIGPFDAFPETVAKLAAGGCLLVAGRAAEPGWGNPMTIGWGTLGTIWGKPVFTVLVRPSRYTFGLLEALGEYTVNVPPDSLDAAVAACGSVSGRDADKAAVYGLVLVRAEHVGVPYIAQCPIHYECRVIHKGNVVNADLDADIVRKSYARGDFHRVYYGEILGAWRES